MIIKISITLIKIFFSTSDSDGEIFEKRKVKKKLFRGNFLKILNSYKKWQKLFEFNSEI